MYNPTKPYKKQVLELIKTTWKTDYVYVKDGLVTKKFFFPEYQHTDGIGTKGVYHWKNRTFTSAVIDAMAMNLNDLAMMRARPYAVIDHLMLPEEDEQVITRIIQDLSIECKKRNIAITGGETAIHDNMSGLELSITMLGFVDNPKPNKLQPGDVLIGIESNGLHSNGFTKVRDVFGRKDKPELTNPTFIYSDNILRLNEHVDIHGMMHITGGAFTKLKDIIDNSNIEVINTHSFQPHIIFRELYSEINCEEEMYKTFNCGIGFVLGVAEKEVDACLNSITTFKAEVIGKVTEGKGRIIIDSAFSGKKIEL